MTPKKEKIRLAVCISDFRIGGAQKIVADLVNHLNTDRYEVHLITFFLSEKEDTFHSILRNGVHVHKLNWNKFTDLRSWFETYKLLKLLKPDIVFSHLYFSNFITRCLKPFISYKVIVVEHNIYASKTSLQIFFDRLLAKLTYKIVAVSKGVASFTSQQERISIKKFIIIPNGVDVDCLYRQSTFEKIREVKKELDVKSANKIIITIGQLIRQKNHTLLIEAFSKFINGYPDYRLVILGGGSGKKTLTTLVKDLSIEDSIIFPGIKNEVGPYLAAANFFVLPSLFEGFGIVCIEAMAMGLPVISTRVTGPDSYIKDGKNGLFTDGTVSDLVDKMSAIADLNEERMSVYKNNAIRTANLFRIDEVIREYENLFEESIKSNLP